MSAQLVGIHGPLAGRTFPLGDHPLKLGRSDDNQVVIAETQASRYHAELRREGSRWVLHDLGSSNGTRVNRQAVQQHELNPGDIIEIAGQQFRFESESAAQAATEAFGRSSALPPPPFGGNEQAPLPPVGGVPPMKQPAKRRNWPLLIGGCLLAIVALCGISIGSVFLFGRDFLEEAGAPSVFPIFDSAQNQPTREAVSAAPTLPPVATREPPPPGTPAWTVMVYLDGDNDLERPAVKDFLEMASVGSTDQVNIVVQFDRIDSRERWNDNRFGDWSDTKRFLVEEGMEPTPDNAIESIGEANMGDPATLTDFIVWSVENFPAQQYALILWDHGASWPGIASDDTDDGDIITMPELASALSDARLQTGIDKLDLIGFDACLMAQIDVLQTVAPFGHVAVASAELEPADGWDYEAFLGQLVARPDMSVEELSAVIVETYVEFYDRSRSRDITLSAFDLAKVDEMTARLDILAGAMLDNMQTSYRPIAQARSFAPLYAPSEPFFAAVDLGNFAELLERQQAAPEIVSAANDLRQTIEEATISLETLELYVGTSGISVYFPQLSDYYVAAYNIGSPLPRQTRWSEFLETFHTSGETLVNVPTISDLQLDNPTASFGRPSILTGDLVGRDIAYVIAAVGTLSPSGNAVDLLYGDFIYPPGTVVDGNTPPDWPDGDFTLSMNVDASNWYISNGSNQIPALLVPIAYGENRYGVKGVYTSATTGRQFDAGLIFEVFGGQAELQRVWGFATTGSGSIDDFTNAEPYEIEVEEGDSFTVYTLSVGDGNAGPQGEFIEGETITFGAQPLSATIGPALSGNYVAGFLVIDLAGRYSYQYIDVTFDNSGANRQNTAPATGKPGDERRFELF